jgi:hypothetical protein
MTMDILNHLLFHFSSQLHDSGFRLIWSDLNRCSGESERLTCRPELRLWRFACGRAWVNAAKKRRSCHNLLFIRDQRRHRVVHEQQQKL